MEGTHKIVSYIGGKLAKSAYLRQLCSLQHFKPVRYSRTLQQRGERRRRCVAHSAVLARTSHPHLLPHIHAIGQSKRVGASQLHMKDARQLVNPLS